MSHETYDFSGWATKNNILCSDGRTIAPGAFAHLDGAKVPLVWNHQHNDPKNILGHAYLYNRPEGVYTKAIFNDTESGRAAQHAVQNGDIVGLSIYANGLKHDGRRYVTHGNIRELSLVITGANPGAFIDSVMKHGERCDDEAIIYTGETLDVSHSETEEPIMNPDDLSHATTDEETVKDVVDSMSDKQKTVMYALIAQALADANGEMAQSMMHADDSEAKDDDKETVKDVYDAMSEKQKTVVHFMVGTALEEAKSGKSTNDEKSSNDEDSKKGDDNMKHNAFDKNRAAASDDSILSHSAQMEIVNTAKSIGSFQKALEIYHAQLEEDGETLQHGFDDIDNLFPDYKNLKEGAPDLVDYDQGWVNRVMSTVHKSPYSRIRTRQMDIRMDKTGKGYVKGEEKALVGNAKLIKRTTDPQTIYVKDALERDDIIDITDFDIVAYQYSIMRHHLNETIAIAAMLGDGRDDGDDDKIYENHVRSIWHDDELYTIHADVDIAAAKEEIQGTGTSTSFGDNYIYAEAMITAALYAREDYRGSGSMDFYCAPRTLNTMLLARDLNGRRIYNSKADLSAALDVVSIQTPEQFANQTREVTVDSSTFVKQLLGIFVNMNDYVFGSTKGGEITKFNQFDIDFNQQKYLIETRLSGALRMIKSAIVLELDVTPEDDSDDTDSDG